MKSSKSLKQEKFKDMRKLKLALLHGEFHHVNQKYFDGTLPACEIKAARADSTRYGSFRYIDKSNNPDECAIIIKLERRWEDMQETLRHEMAHFAEWVHYGVTTDSSDIFAWFCEHLEVAHTVYRGRYAHSDQGGLT